MRTLAERLWSRVAPPDGDSCREWQGSRLRRGYGTLNVDGTVKRTHRVAYELAHGPIPEGMHVLHICDNPPCCNPAHLFLGTHAENMADRESKGRNRMGPARDAAARQRKQRTSCTRGHAYDEANTIVLANGGRDCRACKREKDRLWRQKRRASA